VNEKKKKEGPRKNLLKEEALQGKKDQDKRFKEGGVMEKALGPSGGKKGAEQDSNKVRYSDIR